MKFPLLNIDGGKTESIELSDKFKSEPSEINDSVPELISKTNNDFDDPILVDLR